MDGVSHLQFKLGYLACMCVCMHTWIGHPPMHIHPSMETLHHLWLDVWVGWWMVGGSVGLCNLILFADLTFLTMDMLCITQFWTFFWHLYIWFLTSALYRAVFILCSKLAIIQHNHFISHSWHVIASINHFKLYLLVFFHSFLKQVATQRSQIVRKLPKMWITVCNC